MILPCEEDGILAVLSQGLAALFCHLCHLLQQGVPMSYDKF